MLKKLRASAKKDVTDDESDLTKEDLADLFDVLAENPVLAAAFIPIYKSIARDAGTNAGLLVGSTFDSNTDAIRRYFETRSQKASSAINDETDKQLKASLAEGIANGESIQDLIDRVEQVFGAAAGYRAERIARTETIAASTYASISAWDQSGVVDAKEWFTAQDERVCLFCNSMDGQIVSLDTDYFKQGDSLDLEDGEGRPQRIKFDFSAIDGPPLHANCRCTLIPVTVSVDGI